VENRENRVYNGDGAVLNMLPNTLFPGTTVSCYLSHSYRSFLLQLFFSVPGKSHAYTKKASLVNDGTKNLFVLLLYYQQPGNGNDNFKLKSDINFVISPE
jgi:hypothetical protein